MIFVIVLGAALAGGCWLEVDRWHGGYATLHWTIDGRADAAACRERGATWTRIHTIDVWGDTEDTTTAPCDAFEQTIFIHRGWYRSELTLLDSAGASISDTLTSKVFLVDEHDSIFVDAVDFPGCPPVPMYFPYCPNGVVVELRDPDGCITGYECVSDGGAANARAQTGDRCIALDPVACGVVE